MQHQLDAWDVEAAGGDVRCHKDGVLALAELLQAAVAGSLADVSVEHHAWHGLANTLSNLTSDKEDMMAEKRRIHCQYRQMLRTGSPTMGCNDARGIIIIYFSHLIAHVLGVDKHDGLPSHVVLRDDVESCALLLRPLDLHQLERDGVRQPARVLRAHQVHDEVILLVATGDLVDPSRESRAEQQSLGEAEGRDIG